MLENPKEFKSSIIGVAGDYLRGVDIVNVLNKHLKPNVFAYGNFSTKTFASFGFPGCVDLANMFEYYQTGKMKRDIKLSKQLNGDVLSFEDWVIKNKNTILHNLSNI